MDNIIILSKPDIVKTLHCIKEKEIRAAAKAKLKRIIEREGDLGGARRTPEYMEQLIAEERYQRAMRDYCMAHYKGGRNERV